MALHHNGCHENASCISIFLVCTPVQKARDTPVASRERYTRALLSGLAFAYSHEKGHCHNHVKSDNIVVAKHGTEYIVKAIKFGKLVEMPIDSSTKCLTRACDRAQDEVPRSWGTALPSGCMSWRSALIHSFHPLPLARSRQAR